MRAQGWRWPAISPSDALRRRFVPEHQPADGERLDRIAGQAGRRLRIVVAGDPEPVAAGHQRGEIDADGVGQARRAVAIVKAVAEADDDPRAVVIDHRLQPEQRRRGVVRRNEHAAPRQRRAFFEMQVGDAEQPERRGNTARRGGRTAPSRRRSRSAAAWASPARNIGSAFTACCPSPLRSGLPPPTEASRRPRRRPAPGPPPA